MIISLTRVFPMSNQMKFTIAVLASQAAIFGLCPAEVMASQVFYLEEATTSSINQAFNTGVLTSEKLVQLYLNRIESYDNSLNSIITVNPGALQTARDLDLERKTSGPRSLLHGIPVILKDNFDTYDMPTTGGSDTLVLSIPPDDAFTVKKLRDAGAVILAKANLSEFALTAGWNGYSSFGGQTLNPYKLNRGPAGSSGGTGAAIAANFGVIGTGSDTGGSIRGPAAANGIVGIKPTRGLLSRDGIIPLALSFDTGGPMTRTVTDAAIALGVMTGVDPQDPVTSDSQGKFYKDYTPFLKTDSLQGARLGVVGNFFGGNPEIDQLIQAAITALGSLGATVEPVTLTTDFLAERTRISNLIFDSEFEPQIEAYLATLGNTYPKTLEEIIAISESPEIVNSDTPVNPGRIAVYKSNLASGGYSNPDYIDAVTNGIPFVKNTLQTILDNSTFDALIYPTARCPASPIINVTDPTFVCVAGPSATNLANISGFPDIQVPAGFTSDGLPTTISFLGRDYSEPTLLGFAYAYEQATLHRSPPPLFPPLPSETIVVSEPGVPVGLGVFGVLVLGLKCNQRPNQQKSPSEEKSARSNG
jgi:amidase